jgi:Fe-S cluster assembly protein SufD
MTQSADKNIQWYISKFQDLEQNLNGEKSSQIHALRREAIRKLADIGFPTSRQEEWRFTNILPITKIDFQPAVDLELKNVADADIRQYFLEDSERLVFIDGIFSPKYSDIGPLPLGTVVENFSETLKKYPQIIQSHIASLVRGDENAFTALNTAFMMDGAFVLTPRGTTLERPLQFLFIAANSERPFAIQPRNIIIAGENSRFKIVETYIGLADNSYLTNSVSEIMLGENSVVEHDKVQAEGVNSFHIGTTHLKMSGSSNFTSNVISLGGSIARNNFTAVLDAEGVECTLNGLSLGKGKQLLDNHTVIDHAKPHGNSHQLYKAILDDASKGVFNGKIFVRQDAQKTDAKQTNKTLLLSDDAGMNTKPQLEIFADDVKCTHGATIGQLDEEQIFYLRSRGIDIDSARDMLTTAFAGDVLNRITIEPLRLQVEEMINERLNNRLSGRSL